MPEEVEEMGYFGSKQASGAYQAIISQMPPHDLYIETHLGGGAVMRLKPPAARSIGIDLDQATLDSFSCSYPVELVCADAHRFIIDEIDYARSGRVLLYVDPPYLHSTRRGKSRYRYEYTDADHVELIRKLQSVPAYVILSGYPSSLYDSLLSDWRTVEFQSMTRGGVRTEKLWMNFDSGFVHWHSYAGKNFAVEAKTVVVVLHALQQPFSRHVHLFGGGADPAGKVGLELLLSVARDVAEGFAHGDVPQVVHGGEDAGFRELGDAGQHHETEVTISSGKSM